MTPLTEDEIKSAFLPYLKEFYRFRYEYLPNTEQASLNNITADGFVADGMLSFVKPDGASFLCTYEATSTDKIEEVKFSLNQSYFLWDCGAFGAFAAAVVYAFFYISDSEFIANLSFAGKWGMPFGIGFIAFFCWYFLMRDWKKYRYIYAIEQFKRYHADEQWVAIGEDVFPAITSPFFTELKDQCVYNGIGLAIVYSDRSVRPIAAPSRLGVFGGNRKMAHWITDSQFYQSVATNMRAATQAQNGKTSFLMRLRQTIMRPLRRYILHPLQKALGKTTQPASDIYNRFTGEYLIQKWVTTLSLIIIVAVSNAATKHQDIVDIDHQPDLYRPEQLPPVSPERDRRYVRNEGEVPIPYGKVYSPESPTNPSPSKQKQSSAAPSPSKQKQSPATDKSSSEDKTTSITPKSGSGLCDIVRKAGGWYIQDNQFSLEERAKQRVEALKKQKIGADYFNGACLGRQGWIVRLGPNLYAESAARTAAAAFEQQLEKAGLKTGIPLHKKVEQ